MAASVQNQQYHRSDSPFRGCNNFVSSPREASPKKQPPQKEVNNYYDSSSGSEDEIEDIDFRKLSVGLEASIHDPKDEATADNWIERNASMIRLTGKHPFNSEAPLKRLMQYGFITPVPLHYVRNHGSVPRGSWKDWTVEVTGLVKRPMIFSMEQLVKEFSSIELPVTLVCAGNRRKEQNMVKQTIGFNWGSAGVSTSVWRGVRLRDVLRRCGIHSRSKGALNVCFEGAEKLPGGGGSKYGTSLRKEFAMDPARDIILAYMQNGELLAPDHGFPVRMIIPGFIGGRMVKWLTKIIVAPEESQSYYHFNDNRVLPSHVDAELATAEGWWFKPEHIINELNINSVITTPSHEEILLINTATTQRPYQLKGYAYSGGGKKVTRVEVTLDNGETWLVCDLDHPEKPNKYGKYWCWCFWSLELEVLDLLGAKEIAVRAWDETLNTQPEKLIWNLMGMMNNCWFRVKTNICKPQRGELGMVFEHPTQAGNNPGGWMARMKHLESSEAPSTLKKSVSSPFMNTSSRMYSMYEVKKHNSAESAWIIVHGHVYDCTRFLKDHPGGMDSILINAGTDCTEEFDAIHSEKAKGMIETYRIGELINTGYVSDSSSSTTPNNSVHGAANLMHLEPIREGIIARSNLPALNPRERIHCKLVSKTSISHDVRVFRFALPAPDQVLGLPVGKHIFIYANIDDKLCMRAYTPTSSVDQVGYFELLIKIYFKAPPKFPNGGVMSQYLDSLPMGSVIDFKGPLGHIEYTGRGNFLSNGKHKFAKKLALVAGGTGITPIYQVMQAILKDPEDDTEMYVVYANRTEDDILLREELDAWAQQYSDRVKVWYVVGEVTPGKEDWKYSVGFITADILKEHMPQAADDTLALACGPPPMIKFAVRPNLEAMNYDVENTLLVF